MRGTRYVTLDLTGGTHTVRVEYFEATQAAKAIVNWERVGKQKKWEVFNLPLLFRLLELDLNQQPIG